MCRYTRFVETAIGLWILLNCCAESGFANGLGPYRRTGIEKALDTWLMVGPFIANYIATAVIEFVVIYLLLRRPAKACFSLLVWVLVVNLITNPTAQLAWLTSERWIYWRPDSALIIESVTIVAEFVLLMLVFKRLYRCGLLAKPVSLARGLIVTVSANLASFIFVLGSWVLLDAIMGMRIP